MKRPIYFAYLGLLLLTLFSCQKENIRPAANASDTSAEKTLNCPTYSYSTKTSVVNLGSIRDSYILIDFNNNVTPARKLQLLNQFEIFDSLEADFFMESGLLGVARLSTYTNCLAIEDIINNLNTLPEVSLATPVFEPFPQQVGIFEWMGLTGEIIVEMKAPNSYSLLQRLAATTGTTIVGKLYGETYLLLADKNSAGTPLQIVSTLNGSNLLASAEPNFVFQYITAKKGQPGAPPRQTTVQLKQGTKAIINPTNLYN